MGVMRSALLAASESRWLRQQAPRMGFVKKAVRRFMPGERVEDALAAAAELRREGITAVVTKLGENVSEMREANAVATHYVDVLAKIEASGIDCLISVKLTQLGLDVDRASAVDNLRKILEHADGFFIRIDMESSAYTQVTLEIFELLWEQGYRNIGVVLQADLFRTEKDEERLSALGARVRLVKGAYREPKSVAYQKKGDVDAAFARISQRLLERGRARVGKLSPAILVVGLQRRPILGQDQTRAYEAVHMRVGQMVDILRHCPLAL